MSVLDWLSQAVAQKIEVTGTKKIVENNSTA